MARAAEAATASPCSGDADMAGRLAGARAATNRVHLCAGRRPAACVVPGWARCPPRPTWAGGRLEKKEGYDDPLGREK